jgi:hypothetical protein
MWRRGFLSTRLFMYPGIEDPSVLFVNDVRTYIRIKTLNSPSGKMLVQHKHAFAECLAARGLAEDSPEVYGIVTARGFRPRSSGAQEGLRAQKTVVLKPLSGHGGMGVRLARAADVETLTTERRGELLVQERLTPHPLLHEIFPGSLNTVRVLYVRHPGDGPVLAAAVHRFGTSETGPVDNGSSGGVWAPVDLETGRMGVGLSHPRAPHRPQYHRHPDTRVQIAGVVVPQWVEVRDLARRLMAAFPELDHVGWDIAVTDRGPRVIEGNAVMPALSIFQYSGSFLNDPRLCDYYVRHGMLSAQAVRRSRGSDSTGFQPAQRRTG